MSAIKLATPSSGSISLSPANTASNLTITVPAVTGTMAIQGPAFSAYQSTLQSVSNGVNTKVQLQTEVFDTASCFDSTTNYRFTPNVAGYYQISGALGWASGINARNLLMVWKNGGEYTRLQDFGSLTYCSSGSTLVYLNGSTDYVELYVYQGGGSSQNTTASSTQTWFSGVLVRAA
jgi:hypothetical protein